MFRSEARRIGDWLAQLPDSELSPFVNIGSGTFDFRLRQQPWVDEHIFSPLRGRRIPVTHVEIREGPGIDLVADILSDEGYEKIAALKPNLILLSNVIEHVYEPARMVERCREALAPGGRLLITVPRSYPHHTKIDTMLRPTPQEVARWAPKARVEQSTILETEYHWHEIARNPRKAMLAKAKWLFKPYTVSMLMLAAV